MLVAIPVCQSAVVFSVLVVGGVFLLPAGLLLGRTPLSAILFPFFWLCVATTTSVVLTLTNDFHLNIVGVFAVTFVHGCAEIHRYGLFQCFLN